MRLNESERKQALSIFETLSFMKAALKPGALTHIKKEATNSFILQWI
jgi:hypothetical protein